MIADLHAHYPMHLIPEEKGSAIDAITTARGRRRLRDVIRAWLVGIASRFGNYRSFVSGPAFVKHKNPFNGLLLTRPIDTIVGETAVALHRSNFSNEAMPAVIEPPGELM